MNKEKTIIRKKERNLKNRKRKNDFNIDVLRKEIRREIFQMQNGRHVENIFREDLEGKEVFMYDN